MARNNPALNLTQILAQLGGQLRLPPGAQSDSITITGIAPLEQAGVGDIAFLARSQFLSQLQTANPPSCLIVSHALADAPALAQIPCILTPDAYHYYARLSQWWRVQTQPTHHTPRIHPSAVIAPDALVHETAHIGPLCVVESGAVIGAHSRLAARVTLGFDCTVGEYGMIHSGVVIGADGFGFAPHEGEWEKIEQLGTVRIGNRVEIGANTCIDRAALGETVIEDGVKIDNLVQIAHNVHIGAHTALAACVGVAGSARIGSGCTIGGGAIVLGHLELADGVNISAASVVMRSIRQPGHYSGIFPIDSNANWEKNAVTLKQLHSLRDRVRQLEKRA